MFDSELNKETPSFRQLQLSC